MVVLLVYVNDFCYYRNCLYTTGTSTALMKNRSMRVPIYSIDSIAPWTSVRIHQSGQIGIWLVTQFSGIRAPTGGITI